MIGNVISQSVSWWCFVPDLLSPEVFVREVASAGYAAIELAPLEYFPLIRDHGLALSGIGGHVSISSGLNDVSQHARIEAELLDSIETARKWETPHLICFSGDRGSESGIDATVQGLLRVARQAEDASVTLTIELLNSKVDHPGYEFDRSAWGVEVCRRVGLPNVKLLYDIYHAQIMEGDLIRTIREAAPFISHFHTAGNPGRNEVDGTQEIHYPAVYRAIAETGFEGYIAHEFVPRGEPIASLRKAYTDCAEAISQSSG